LQLASGTKTPTIYVCSGTPQNFAAPNTELAIVAGPTADQIDVDHVIAAVREMLS
jgi:hypothetical protein